MASVGVGLLDSVASAAAPAPTPRADPTVSEPLRSLVFRFLGADEQVVESICHIQDVEFDFPRQAKLEDVGDHVQQPR